MRGFLGKLLNSEYIQPFLLLSSPLIAWGLVLYVCFVLLKNSLGDYFRKDAFDG